MTMTEEMRAKVSLYIRMTLGAGLLGIGYGYYMQVRELIEMTGYLHFEFAIRGIIIGAFFWALQIFILNGPLGVRIRPMPYWPKLSIKTVAFLIVIQVGFWIGDMIFNPEKYF